MLAHCVANTAERLAYLFVGVVLLTSAVGCAPNAQGVMSPTLPWTRNTPTYNPNPYGNPNAYAGYPNAPAPNSLSTVFSRPTLPSNSPRVDPRRRSFLNDMLRRANEQESLAEKQRLEIAQLRTIQADQLDRDREYVTRQRQLERQLLAKQLAAREQQLAKQVADKERLMAQREQQYRGRYNQMRGRASDLDTNNRDMHAQLAKVERERQLLRDELELMKGQLADTTQQLTRTRSVGLEQNRRLQEADQRVQALQASATKRMGNASIRANRSVGRPVTAIDVPGMNIRQDGDLVRLSIPTANLFMAGTAQLHQESQPYLGQVAQILEQYYPQQRVVVDAHTDRGSAVVGSSQWRSLHQLTAAQAMAIFEQLVQRRVNPGRMHTMANGANHPIVSDGTPQGQAMNRRIDIVVYPETY